MGQKNASSCKNLPQGGFGMEEDLSMIRRRNKAHGIWSQFSCSGKSERRARKCIQHLEMEIALKKIPNFEKETKKIRSIGGIVRK